ncbi:hypothetical protein BS50DRAFT_584977 [Corynespora cassiicola Philippines]|uniref:Uncharacterized protein n=1 Tax=Corynespora cassiicola Philippines TaxID=1448308 RepID=A0A2T2P1F1_CORCC|nr:hypothetical protein BS50DRAFT_584977 [Corynespora cassiicola Philippines]
MDTVWVMDGGYPNQPLSYSDVLEHFPALWEHIMQEQGVDLEILAHILDQSLPKRKGPVVIQSALRILFGSLSPPQQHSKSLSRRLGFRLSKMLCLDMNTFDPSKGLARGRNRFYILARFAQMSQSTSLARALIDLFLDFQHPIIDERPNHLHDWADALRFLYGLEPEYTIEQCLDYLERDSDYFPDFHRGRSPGRIMILEPRARTMPPPIVYRPPTPQIQPPRPQWILPPAPLLLSPKEKILLVAPLPPPRPAMSLALAPYNNNDNEIARLAARQRMLEDKVNQIDYDVNAGPLFVSPPQPRLLRNRAPLEIEL